MERRKFSRKYRVEAVRLVRDRGISVAQAARDLEVHENVLRKWVKKLGGDPAHASIMVARSSSVRISAPSGRRRIRTWSPSNCRTRRPLRQCH